MPGKTDGRRRGLSGDSITEQLRGPGSPAHPPCLRRRTALHYAAANGSYQCAVTLVTAGAGVNEADCKGCSPLHYAAASDTYRR